MGGWNYSYVWKIYIMICLWKSKTDSWITLPGNFCILQQLCLPCLRQAFCTIIPVDKAMKLIILKQLTVTNYWKTREAFSEGRGNRIDGFDLHQHSSSGHTNAKQIKADLSYSKVRKNTWVYCYKSWINVRGFEMVKLPLIGKHNNIVLYQDVTTSVNNVFDCLFCTVLYIVMQNIANAEYHF